MFGSKGVLETEYGSQVLIRGDNFYRGGQTPRIYEEGAVNNIASFHSDIQNGRFENPTVAPSVTAICSRFSAGPPLMNNVRSPGLN